MSSFYAFGSRSIPGILAMHRMVQNPFAVKDATPTRSMMADSTENKDSRPIISPPTFNPGQNDADSSRNRVSSSFLLKPPVFSNPFKKTAESEDKPCEVSTTKEGPSPAESSRAEEDDEAVAASDDDEPGAKAAPREPTVAPSRSSPVPVSNSAFGENAAAASGDEFVFGQNMNERVKNARSNASNCTNGSSPSGLFTQGAMETTSKGDPKCDEVVDQGKYSKSLTESALEYEQRQVKRTYDEVAVVTGEEEESNVLQMNCKLFAFDKVTGTWVERGHGLLRLNDKELEGGALQSRLVMRTQGSLRVILNTKVWGAMSVDRPSSKSVRITAIDGDSIKVFLIMASPKDTELLFGALDWRLATLKSTDERKGAEGEAPAPEPRVESEEPAPLDAQGPSTSTKKRRVTPPQTLRREDGGFEPQLQEKKVDSTRDGLAGSGSGPDDSCQDLP